MLEVLLVHGLDVIEVDRLAWVKDSPPAPAPL
jgi:hypothetical protein